MRVGSFLDSRDIKDAWLLQGQWNIILMPSPSSPMDPFAVFDGGAAAGATLINNQELILER